MRESDTKRITITTQESHDGVTVYVDDSGSGVDPNVHDRLFTPFTTTKPPGAGLGLGLSICASIMKAHGGSIQVERSPAGGARFILRFPVWTDETTVPPGTSALGSELHRL
jgi:C4-dicarboxylate-specific signal transduction histidine kinase